MKSCNYSCLKYKVKDRSANRARYLNGEKRCQFCAVFIIWEGLYCPCCGNRLRTLPRNKHFKAKYKEGLALGAS